MKEKTRTEKIKGKTKIASICGELPYTFILKRWNTYWSIEVKELPGCMSDGRDPTEAVENVKDAIIAWVEAAIDFGVSIPYPTVGQKKVWRKK